jgi:hypothetical protein
MSGGKKENTKRRDENGESSLLLFRRYIVPVVQLVGKRDARSEPFGASPRRRYHLLQFT